MAAVNSAVINSWWRERRLLLICWHGVSNHDEHSWNPSLFMSAETLRMRLELIRALKCNVLPLGEALAMVRSATLPPRAIALTIDDGDSSFYLRTWPMLRTFGFPATLYWTTYYSTHPYAVFDPMLSYLLWKGRKRALVLREPTLQCELRFAQEQARAFDVIYRFSKAAAWTSERKEHFLAELAALLEIDYSEIRSRRVLHLISPEEARSMVAEGLDLQLHTHRHRSPLNSVDFASELAANSSVLREAGAKDPAHFCYPSGSFVPEFAEWLRDSGIQSAVTCQSGLIDRHANPFFLPRLIDHEGISPAEFRGWLSGIAATVRGRQRMAHHGFR
ncbi:MAG: polysaccharide deacetylase family protein [Steroidobacteraceae bacterium]